MDTITNPSLPQVTTGPVSGVDGVEVSVIFDFGVGAPSGWARAGAAIAVALPRAFAVGVGAAS